MVYSCGICRQSVSDHDPHLWINIDGSTAIVCRHHIFLETQEDYDGPLPLRADEIEGFRLLGYNDRGVPWLARQISR